MNFEDFLALHFDDDLFDQWYDTISATGHFCKPLLGDVYAPVSERLGYCDYGAGRTDFKCSDWIRGIHVFPFSSAAETRGVRGVDAAALFVFRCNPPGGARRKPRGDGLCEV